ncbi:MULTISPECIES: hypothetical protein [unclassified Pseudomonas]|uniref:hypothetical protein n=1 Tax=unclassified Pseudomonas TaxID=196821 RepID=UPI00088C9F21|nr:MULTISPECIES: hypothetical protein [unclassified Pseudomonas]SCZ06012.1 hypothetical protein SAMN03159391_04950 [Pseudomonas sp. NFACC37-1]SFO82243.1 hypothetical protein SAMN03159304_05197 [Pseudomonas sp. NFACC24-1]
MIFQLAVIDDPIDLRHAPETGDLLIEFEHSHRAAANKRFQVRFKLVAFNQVSNALNRPSYP